MPKQPKAAAANEQLTNLREQLAQLIARHAPTPGEHNTAVPNLQIFRRVATTACYRVAYEPGLSLFAQGRKRVNLGGKLYRCDGASFLLSSIDVPVESQIVEASEEKPMFSLFLKLDMSIVREILASDNLPDAEPLTRGAGIAVGSTTAGMYEACIRLIGLLDTPRDIPFLGRHIQRELIYRLLCTPQGVRLRAIATTGDLSNRTARAITWLRDNYAKPLHMEDLAATARMGVSTLHHQFRALTAMSPLQYQKQLRLQSARRRMLMDGMDATSAAFEVGYESVSQFNREYSRLFGQPPMRDVKTLRTTNCVITGAA